MVRDKVTLHGAFHGSNFGDLLLLQIQLQWLGDAGITEVCVPNMPVRAHDFIELPKGMRILRGCSRTVVFGGGGYFGSPAKLNIKWLLSWVAHHGKVLLNTAFFGRRVILLGTGVGPLPPFPFNYLIKRCLDRAETIVPRDIESAEFLQGLVGEKAAAAVHVGTDLAIGLAGRRLHKARGAGQPEILGIHLAPPAVGVEDFNNFLEELGKKLSSFDIEIRILVDQSGTNGAKRQLEAGHKVAVDSGLKYQVVQLETVDQFVCAISECDRVITSKLHVGIVARCSGVSVFSVPTHIKTLRFYKHIGDSEFCKPWGAYTVPSLIRDIGIFLSRENKPSAIPAELISRVNDIEEVFRGLAPGHQ